MDTKLTAEEAIRQTILEGCSGDFNDLADVIKKRFGLHVSAGLIEEVYFKLQREGTTGTTASKVSTLPHPVEDRSIPRIDFRFSPTESVTVSKPDRVLDFVRMMGGFDAAREAITELEKSLKQLMK